GKQLLSVTDGVHAASLEVATKPLPIIQGGPLIEAGQPYILSLGTTPLGNVVITSWTIVWGDGTTTTVTGNPSTATHIFVDAPNREESSATATASLFGPIPAANIVSPLVVIPKLSAAAGVLVSPGETATLDLPGAFGLTATLVRSPTGTGRVKLFVGLYSENPPPPPVPHALFYQGRVTPRQLGDRLTGTFPLPPRPRARAPLLFAPTPGTYP